LRRYDADIEPEVAANVLIEAADAPTSSLPEMLAEAFGHIVKLNPPDKADRRFLESTGKRWVSAVRTCINASVPRPSL